MARESLKKPHVLLPIARIAGIYRYPVKGLTPEPLAAPTLKPGQTLLGGPPLRHRERPLAASIRPSPNGCRNRIS